MGSSIQHHGERALRVSVHIIENNLLHYLNEVKNRPIMQSWDLKWLRNKGAVSFDTAPLFFKAK